VNKNDILTHNMVRKHITLHFHVTPDMLQYDGYCRDKLSANPIIKTNPNGYIPIYVRENNYGGFAYDFDVLD
jgi:hypothetical protein